MILTRRRCVPINCTLKVLSKSGRHVRMKESTKPRPLRGAPPRSGVGVINMRARSVMQTTDSASRRSVRNPPTSLCSATSLRKGGVVETVPFPRGLPRVAGWGFAARWQRASNRRVSRLQNRLWLTLRPRCARPPPSEREGLKKPPNHTATIANTTRSTTAPASRSGRAAAVIVAPVVRMSSTSSTRLFLRSTSSASPNAPETFVHRFARERFVCDRVGRVRTSRPSGTSGRPSSTSAIPSAMRRLWL